MPYTCDYMHRILIVVDMATNEGKDRNKNSALNKR